MQAAAVDDDGASATTTVDDMSYLPALQTWRSSDDDAAVGGVDGYHHAAAGAWRDHTYDEMWAAAFGGAAPVGERPLFFLQAAPTAPVGAAPAAPAVFARGPGGTWQEIGPGVRSHLPRHFGGGYEVQDLTAERAGSFVNTARLLFRFPHEAIVPLDTSPEEVEQGVRLEKWVRVPDGRVFCGSQSGTGRAGPSTRTTEEWASVSDGAEWLAERNRINATYGPNVFHIVPGMPAPAGTPTRRGEAPQGDSDGGAFRGGWTRDSQLAEPQQRAGRAAALPVAALAEAAAAASEDLRRWVDDSMDRDRHNRLGGP